MSMEALPLLAASPTTATATDQVTRVKFNVRLHVCTYFVSCVALIEISSTTNRIIYGLVVVFCAEPSACVRARASVISPRNGQTIDGSRRMERSADTWYHCRCDCYLNSVRRDTETPRFQNYSIAETMELFNNHKIASNSISFGKSPRARYSK